MNMETIQVGTITGTTGTEDVFVVFGEVDE